MVNMYSIKLSEILKTASTSEDILNSMKTLDDQFKNDRILTVLNNFHKTNSLNFEDAELISDSIATLSQ